MDSCSTELCCFALLSGVFTGRYARRQILEPENMNLNQIGRETTGSLENVIGEQIEVDMAQAANSNPYCSSGCVAAAATAANSPPAMAGSPHADSLIYILKQMPANVIQRRAIIFQAADK